MERALGQGDSPCFLITSTASGGQGFWADEEEETKQEANWLVMGIDLWCFSIREKGVLRLSRVGEHIVYVLEITKNQNAKTLRVESPGLQPISRVHLNTSLVFF